MSNVRGLRRARVLREPRRFGWGKGHKNAALTIKKRGGEKSAVINFKIYEICPQEIPLNQIEQIKLISSYHIV